MTTGVRGCCDNDFWKFSLALYSQPGVPEACLALQEKYSIDVNVLLFCGWLGWSRKVRLEGRALEGIQAVVAGWHQGAVKPLRSARRYLKGVAAGGAAELRQRVKAVELEAEKIEQEMLFLYAEREWPRCGSALPGACVLSNIQMFVRASGYHAQAGDEPWMARIVEAAVTLAPDVRE